MMKYYTLSVRHIFVSSEQNNCKQLLGITSDQSILGVNISRENDLMLRKARIR